MPTLTLTEEEAVMCIAALQARAVEFEMCARDSEGKPTTMNASQRERQGRWQAVADTIAVQMEAPNEALTDGGKAL